MSKKKMLGIDIGSYRIKFVESDSGRLRKVVTVDMPDNIVKNGRVVSFAALAAFIKATVKKNKLRYTETALSLSSENYYIRRVRLPLMSTALLNVNLPFEFHDYISGDMSKYLFDYAVLATDEKDMDLIAVAVAKDLVTNYRVMLKKAGLKLVKIVPDVLTISAVLYHPERIADPSKTKRQINAERRVIEKMHKLELERTEKNVKEHELELKKAEKEKKKAEKKLAKSGYIIDRSYDDFEADSDNADNVNDSNGYLHNDDSGNGLSSEGNLYSKSADNELFAMGERNNQNGDAGAANVKEMSDNSRVNPAEGRTASPQKKKSNKDFAVLDIGFNNTELHFFSNYTFEITRTMDEGEHQIAQYIADEHGVDIHIAMLKLEHNQDGVLEEQGILDRFDVIATEIMRVMNFYSYNNPKNSIDKIYYFGGGSGIDALIKAISQTTELPLYPISDIIPGLPEDLEHKIQFGLQAFGAVIE